jgi:arylsulfatase A-like enzyme
MASAFVIVHQIETNNLYARRKHINDYTRMVEVVKTVVADTSLGLVVVHWPVPHPPGIYNRREDHFELMVESSYLDNLRLVDHTLGELRRDMENSGTWENTILLLTSDHWFRSFWKTIGFEPDEANKIIPTDADQRVPFLLKLAGQKQAVTYDSAFNNVVAHDLVLALLRGEVSSPDGVVSWIDQRRSSGQTPYRFNLSQ